MSRDRANQRIRFTGPRGWQRVSASAIETAQRQPATMQAAQPLVQPAASIASASTLVAARDEASWLSSSFDLMAGLRVSDFEDTVPSEWLDELGL
jgi:hypothetical protein